MLDPRIERIYDFLINNREYNKALQESWYKSVIIPYHEPSDKTIALLHHIANTQSQPKIDKLACFFRELYDAKSKLKTFSGFLEFLGVAEYNKNVKYQDIFDLLKGKPGWGDKTAALFIKSIYHCHSGEYHRSLKIWEDAPLGLQKDEIFFLPVDAVIIHLFEYMSIPTRLDFKGINSYLLEFYKGETIEVWDDLWFWGFISQKRDNGGRAIMWNADKYWVLLHSDKTPEKINEIEQKVVEFITIVKSR